MKVRLKRLVMPFLIGFRGELAKPAERTTSDVVDPLNLNQAMLAEGRRNMIKKKFSSRNIVKISPYFDSSKTIERAFLYSTLCDKIT